MLDSESRSLRPRRLRRPRRARARDTATGETEPSARAHARGSEAKPRQLRGPGGPEGRALNPPGAVAPHVRGLEETALRPRHDATPLLARHVDQRAARADLVHGVDDAVQ